MIKVLHVANITENAPIHRNPQKKSPGCIIVHSTLHLAFRLTLLPLPHFPESHQKDFCMRWCNRGFKNSLFSTFFSFSSFCFDHDFTKHRTMIKIKSELFKQAVTDESNTYWLKDEECVCNSGHALSRKKVFQKYYFT